MEQQKSAEAVVVMQNQYHEGLNLSRAASHMCSLSGS